MSNDAAASAPQSVAASMTVNLVRTERILRRVQRSLDVDWGAAWT